MRAPNAFFCYLFDWRGRIGRVSFISGLVATSIASAVLRRAAHAWPMIDFLIFSLGVWTSLCLEAKRWLDMGRSALWILWSDLAILFWVGFFALALDPASSLPAIGRGAGAAAGPPSFGPMGRWVFIEWILPLGVKCLWLILVPGAAGCNDVGDPNQGAHIDNAGPATGPAPSFGAPRIGANAAFAARRTFGRRSL